LLPSLGRKWGSKNSAEGIVAAHVKGVKLFPYQGMVHHTQEVGHPAGTKAEAAKIQLNLRVTNVRQGLVIALYLLNHGPDRTSHKCRRPDGAAKNYCSGDSVFVAPFQVAHPVLLQQRLGKISSRYHALAAVEMQSQCWSFLRSDL
jgi:hypothetical protein